jgi:hypothetical protein
LYDRIYRPDVLRAAWSLVLKNDGAPGVDGVSCRDILNAPEGADGFLQTVQEQLRTKTYRPQAVKRVYIPKPDGRQRPLGIPTVRDRVVQMATLLVLDAAAELARAAQPDVAGLVCLLPPWTSAPRVLSTRWLPADAAVAPPTPPQSTPLSTAGERDPVCPLAASRAAILHRPRTPCVCLTLMVLG